MTLKWRDDSRVKKHGIDVEAARLDLERIRAMDKDRLRAKAIVNESRPRDAVLHPMFEWRNAVAAEFFREWQARQIIKDVRVEVIHEDGTKTDVPAYVSVQTVNDEGKKESYYQSAKIAVTRPDEWLSALAAAQAKVSQARRSVEELEIIARGSDDSDRLARLAIAARALETANEALRH